MWIQKCQESHTRCSRRSRFLPTRLVDVGYKDSESLKLHICNPETDRLEYITLSHCWGGKVPYILTSETMDELQRRIPISELSQNFRDAISTCRRLAKRYIWIDSLCIIQDSVSDWEEQSALMDLIYANSWCTIAAVCAKQSAEGFFRSRNPLLVQPCRLPSKAPVSVVLDVDLMYSGNTITLGSQALYKTPRPLYNRAWAFQERFLSPRVLQFGETLLSWECQEMVAAEVNPDGSFLRSHPMESTEDDDWTVKESIRRLMTVDNIKDESLHTKFLSSWRRILNIYTSMKLTYPSDRLAAIFGFIKHQQRVTGLSYFEGLCLECFIPMLLWYAHSPSRLTAANVKHQGDELLFSLSSPATTLSWASIDVQISYAFNWPCWREGATQTAALDEMPDSRSGINLERVHQYTVQNCGSSVNTDLWSIAIVDNDQELPRTYRYCTKLNTITPPLPQLRRFSIVRLEGPICRFRTEWKFSDSDFLQWSHPFQDIHLRSKEWFYPDVNYMAVCPEGARLNVACLVIIEWHWTEPDLMAPGPLVHDPGRRTDMQVGAWAAGIVLVECSGQGASGQIPGERMYCRVGYFQFEFESPDFGPLRELTRVENVAII